MFLFEEIFIIIHIFSHFLEMCPCIRGHTTFLNFILTILCFFGGLKKRGNDTGPQVGSNPGSFAPYGVEKPKDMLLHILKIKIKHNAFPGPKQLCIYRNT